MTAVSLRRCMPLVAHVRLFPPAAKSAPRNTAEAELLVCGIPSNRPPFSATLVLEAATAVFASATSQPMCPTSEASCSLTALMALETSSTVPFAAR